MSARQPLADIQSAKDQGASASPTGPAPFGLSPASGSQAEPLVPSAVPPEFAKLFATPRGQFLVTLDTDDEAEGYAVRLRGAEVRGVMAQASLSGWDDPEKPRAVFDAFDQAQADEMAERLFRAADSVAR